MLRAVLWSALFIISFIASMGCTATAARNTVTLPAMQQAWASIKTQALREIETDANTAPAGRTAVAVADAAITSGVAAQINAADWPLIYAAVDRDIQRRQDAGLIGQGFAESLREELRLFTESRAAYTRNHQ